MNVDTENDVDTTSTSTGADSAADGSAQVDNQTHDTTTDATSTADESANADNQGGAGNGSLTDRAKNTTTTPPANTGAAKPAQEFVPRKDYAALQGEFTRRSQRIKELERQAQTYDGITPEDVRAWKAQQEAAHKANLPRWNPQHPERAKFDALRERYRLAQNLLSGAKPEEREALKAHINRQFQPEDLKQLEDWHQHREDFTQRLAADPEGTLADMMDQRIQSAFQQQQEVAARRQQASETVDGWFDDPSNRSIIQSQGEWMNSALAENIPWAVVRREAEIRYLRSQRQSDQKTVQSAEEKNRLLRSNATVTRDAGTRPVGDLYDRAKQIARERGLAPGDPRFMSIMDELQAQE